LGARVLVRFFAAAAALFVTANLVGSLTVGPLAALLLALLLALAGWTAASLWPEMGPAGPGVAGWLLGAAVLYGTQFALPIYRVTPFGAIVAGGLVWLIDQLSPIVLG